MKTLSVMIVIGLLAFVALAMYECRPSAQAPLLDASQSPEATFDGLLLKGQHANVTNLQGGAIAWQGYGAALRFEASGQVIDAIIATGYHPSDATKTAEIMQRAKLHSTFNPAWNPQGITNPECYQRQGQTGWSSHGEHTLVIDRENGVVYFAGNGI